MLFRSQKLANSFPKLLPDAHPIFLSLMEKLGVKGEIRHPQNESNWGNVNPFGKRGMYDNGKRAAETLCYDYIHSHNANIRIARLFNTFGENMSPDDGRIVSNFIVQSLLNKPITIYGDGLQTRSLCYVEDTVNGLIALSESEFMSPVNIGNPDEFTMLELAEHVLYKIDTESKLVFKPLPSDDPKQRRPDISKAKTFLD